MLTVGRSIRRWLVARGLWEEAVTESETLESSLIAAFTETGITKDNSTGCSYYSMGNTAHENRVDLVQLGTMKLYHY